MKLIRIPLKNAIEFKLESGVMYQLKLDAKQSVCELSEKQLKNIIQKRLKKLNLK